MRLTTPDTLRTLIVNYFDVITIASVLMLLRLLLIINEAYYILQGFVFFFVTLHLSCIYYLFSYLGYQFLEKLYIIRISFN